MKENSLKVSIILPTYNGARYVRRSIDSCLNQTYTNMELIIVDDGSTDETPQAIVSYKDSRIKHLRHNENKGLAHALNTGFANASGDYLTWTSDDNFYDSEATEKMLIFLRGEKCEFVYCDFYRFRHENPADLKIVRLPDVPELKKNNSIGACFLYSRKVREHTGDYDPDAALAEDYDYWIRVSKKFPMHHLNEPLYYYGEHKESLSALFVKQHEVQLAQVLVLIKNNVIDARHAAKLLIDIIVETKTLSASSMHSHSLPIAILLKLWRRALLSLHRILAAAQFSRALHEILRGFETGSIKLGDAKSSIKKIIANEK